MRSGIYKITCTANGKSYIGASSNIDDKWNHHFSMLRGGYHINTSMQSAYNEYGEESFTFTILKYCEKEQLKEYRRRYLDRLPKKRRFNILEHSNSLGSTKSLAARRKMSKSQKSRIRPVVNRRSKRRNINRSHSLETRTKMSNSHKGKKNTPEQIAKTAAANRGRKRTPETRARMSAAQKGRKHSLETRMKISQSKMGHPVTLETRIKISLGNKGKIVREETREKLRQPRKKRKLKLLIDKTN